MPTKRAVYDIAEFKALPDQDGEQGRFEAIVSVFGNEDTQGDRVLEGAFKNSLAQWQASGHPIPIIWSHQWGNPEAHIGGARPEDVVEVPGRGLKVTGDIDLDDRFGAKVYKLLKTRRVKEFSFGYAVRKQRRAKDGVNELVELDLIEIGPTLKGANDSTELLSIKADLEEVGFKTPPWHIEEGKAGCDGYAVVADETDETVGCHETRAAAERHMAALYANVEDASKGQVPVEVQNWTRAYIDAALAELDLAGFAPGFKAGRSISSKNEARIRGAVDALTEVLASLGDADEKNPTSDTEEAKAQADEPKVLDRDLLALKALIAKG